MDDIKIDIEKLISEVEIRPALWNMIIPEYSDRVIRKKCWEEITNVFGGEDMPIEGKRKLGDLLHKKWKNIRDRFARDIHENKKASGAGANKKPPYIYRQQLLFLKDTLTPKPTTSSLPAEDEVLVVDQLSENTQGETRPPAEKKTQRIGKKRMHPIEEKILLSLERCEKKAKNEDKQVDDNEQFLLSLLPALKSLPRSMNTNCRIELLQCLSRYESSALSQSGQQYPIPTTSHQAQQYHASQHQHSNRMHDTHTPVYPQHMNFSHEHSHQYTPYQHPRTDIQIGNREQNQLPSTSRYSQPISHVSTVRQEETSPTASPAPTLSPGESLATYISSYNTEDDSDYSVF